MHGTRGRGGRRFGLVVALIGLLGSASAFAEEFEQLFPSTTAGSSVRAESGWRIRYQVLKKGTHSYGAGEVLEIQSAEFMRGYTSSGQPDWIRVLNNLVLNEMYVVYNDGEEIYDSTNYPSTFVPPLFSEPSRRGLPRPYIGPDNVVREVVDDRVRWVLPTINPNPNVSPSPPNRMRRGEVLDLWAVMEAGQYCYIVLYSFSDDGTIHVRVGATGHNFRNLDVGENNGIHVHMPVWRLQLALGDATRNMIEVVERKGGAPGSGSAFVKLDRRPFNNGLEGGEIWHPELFTTLMITNDMTQNRHNPPSKVSYMLRPIGSGQLRNDQAFTQYDFWVTRVYAPRPSNPELRFLDVPRVVRQPLQIQNQAVVIWHSVPFQHIPRTEDFGPSGNNAWDGLALTMWAGFDLMPHNLWDKTPLFKR